MVASFSEERFPLGVAFGSSGGPERRIEVVRLSSGYETRNQRHRHSLRRYDAGSGARSLADLVSVLAFFEAKRGKLVGFRFRDPLDHRSSAHGQPISAFDQRIGTGDGSRTTFALTKTYGTGPDAYERPIAKPLAGSAKVAVGETALTDGFELDETAGTVSFALPPAPGLPVTAGFEFDVPVRFDLDQLVINVAAFEAGEIPSIPLVEIRP